MAPSPRDTRHVWYNRRHTPAISLMYFFRLSASWCSSGIGAVTFPRSTTVRPSAAIWSPRPAMRKADGPMSTPRRPPPRSSGTPMMWTGFTSAQLVADGHAFRAWHDDRGEQPRVVLDGVEERLHVLRLVHDIVGEE